MRSEKDIRQKAKEINPSAYVSFDKLYQNNNYRVIVIKKNTHKSFIVPNLDAPDLDDKLKEAIDFVIAHQ